MQKMLFPILTEEVSNLPFYTTSVGSSEYQEPISRPTGYTSYHWLHVRSGEGRLDIGGKEYIISENMGFFFYPRIPHSYVALKEPWKTAWLTFDGYAVPRLLNLMKMDKYKVFDVFDMPVLNSLLDEIYNTVSEDNPFKGFDSSYLIYKFLLGVKDCTNICNPKHQSGSITRLQPLLSFIETNYMKEISLLEMSELLSITPQHLCRLFKHSINMRPFEYLTKCRLRKAKEMLAGSENSHLAKIADNVGYNDVSYFCAIFKENEGMTPLQFRKMHKQI